MGMQIIYIVDTLKMDASYNQPTWKESSLTISEFFNMKGIFSFMSLLRGFDFTIKTLTPE